MTLVVVVFTAIWKRLKKKLKKRPNCSRVCIPA